MYLRPGLGVGRYTTYFGTKKRRGTCPNIHAKAAGGVIRSAFQSLEGLGLMAKSDKGGRVITSKGRADLDRIAATMTQ